MVGSKKYTTMKQMTQRPIPPQLGHHTNFAALKSILTTGIDEGNEICLRAVSNLKKNDSQEIHMGLTIQNAAKEAFTRIGEEHSMFQKTGDYEKSASISFMEGESTPEMLDKYGCYRLDFDLTDVETFGFTDFLDCEYVKFEDLEDYANEYAQTVFSKYSYLLNNKDRYPKSDPRLINPVLAFLMMDIDLCRKPLIVKEWQWHNEREWRKIIQLIDDDDDIHYTPEGKAYKNVYYPLNSLTSITVLAKEKERDEIYKRILELQTFLQSVENLKHLKIRKVLL